MDWVFIDDVVTAFLRAAQLSSVVGEEIDVGTGVLTTARDFADLVRREVGHDAQPTFEPNATRIGEDSPVADTQALQATLGWVPKMSLAAGTHRTVEWYQARVPV